jgi:hypothetical protein
MFFRRLLAANLRLDTSSLALEAKGVAQKATKKAGMRDACAIRTPPEATLKPCQGGTLCSFSRPCFHLLSFCFFLFWGGGGHPISRCALLWI